jgi:undecaprenyl-diphosphatase
MTRSATARPQEDALLARPRQAAFLTAGVVAVTAVVFVLVADHGTLARIQRLDDGWLRLMISGRAPPLTAIAKVFNILGLVYVTLPVRIVLAGFLAVRRRWWHLAAFAAAIVLSEVLIGSLKGTYNRARPPGSLVATTNASFPSGHTIAASVTVVAAVIALVPPGRRRALWGAAAVAFSIVMGLSRAYLGAHWLSDATAGILLGTSCALITALVADQFQRRQNRLQRAWSRARLRRRHRRPRQPARDVSSSLWAQRESVPKRPRPARLAALRGLRSTHDAAREQA